MTRIFIFAVCVFSATACVAPPTPGEGPLSDNVINWRDEVIYQIMTDRFADGDASNNYNTNLLDPSAYHGGDWRGIAEKFDYLEALGVTTLWISPVVKNVESDAGFSSYHGYWTQDFSRPNPHFGDIVALREMVDQAHARGFKVILDIVTNHVGQAFYYDINKNGQPDEFFLGQGGRIVPIGETDSSSELTRILEWDPDFNPDGVQAWTSLGPSGLAPIIFARDPKINRMPPQPDLFAQDYAYNQKGRVTIWNKPEVCGCDPWGCAWNNPCRREQEVLGDFPGGLKDLATHRYDVRNALFDAFSNWIDIGDFDGFRIDTLKHVEHGFWDDFCPRIREHTLGKGKQNFFMFGEAFDGDDNLLGEYTQGQGVDSLFYFSQYYTLFRGALLGDGSRTCEIERLHCRRHGCQDDPCGEGQTFEALYNGAGKFNGPTGEYGDQLNSRQLVVNFLSNHDVGRFIYFMPPEWSQSEKRKLLHLALGYLLTADGIPCLYYGVEQEFEGGNDPANRETLGDINNYKTKVWKNGYWQESQKTYDSDGDGADDTVWEPYDTGNPSFKYIALLNSIRHNHIALRRGELRVRWSTTGSAGDDHGIFAFERQHADENILVVMNLGSQTSSRTSSGTSSMPVGFSSGTTLNDLLDPGNSFQVQSSGCSPEVGEGCLDISVPPRTILILASGS
ncbi:MAG: alpha amylase C-terminal domain-containing protein [Deltaproteobacteria bacterium]|nr:alpha amylase C-terminal domain-containing protein [Deltaproteobacteria bacterium]